MASWECPKCRFKKNVLCPVCGEDKEAGATCAACGSEYSHTTCPRCGYSGWHEEPMETKSYNEKIKEVLKTRKEKYLTYYELMRLAAILDPSSIQLLCVNDPIEVKTISQAAFTSNKEGFMKTFCRLKGVNKKLAGKLFSNLEDASKT